MFFLSPYFTPKLFCFFCLQLLICLCALSTNLSVEISFVTLKYPVLFVLFDLVSILFESYFFHQYILVNFFPVVLSELSFWGYFLSVGFLYISPSIFVSLVITGSLFSLIASFPIQGLYFCLGSFGVYQFYCRQALLQFGLNRSVQWYYSLGYVAILYLLFRSLTWPFSSLIPLGW